MKKQVNLRFSKRVLCYTILLLGVWSCAKEGKIGDDQQDGFVKFYGTSSYDQGFDVKRTGDGGYVILGNTTTPGKGTDISLTKTDAFGNEVWHRTFGGLGNDEGRRFQIESDGGFVITGFISRVNNQGTTTDRDVCLIRTNSEGLSVWGNPILFGDSGVNEEGRSIAITPQGYFIGSITDKEVVVIDSSSGTPVTTVVNQEGEQDIQVIQTHPDGSLTRNIITRGYEGNDIVNDILVLNDEIVLLGSSQNGRRTNAFPTVLLASIKIGDNDFTNAAYNRTIAGQTETGIMGVAKGGNIVLLNNIITSAGTSSIEVVEMTLGLKNETKWAVSYSATNATSTFGSAIGLTNENEFIVSGTAELEGRNRDILLLKLGENGATKWQQHYGSANQDEQGECVFQTQDGGYLALGTLGLASDGSRTQNSTVSLIRTDALGKVK
jgi:hypothetical protein